MFTHNKRIFLQLNRRNLTAPRRLLLSTPFTRFNSSYKVHLNNTTAATSTDSTTTNEEKPTTTTTDNNKESSQISNKIPFVPVINIPETEFAYNSFFSLHRPLLGLSDDQEKPFFPSQSSSTLSLEEQDQEKLDTMLVDHLMNLQHFVEPSPPGIMNTTVEQVKNEGIDFSIVEEAEEIVLNENNEPSLPIFYMPESNDVLDYLTAIETRMKKEHAKLKAEEDANLLRLKKSEILDRVRRRSIPRFYVTSKKSRRY